MLRTKVLVILFGLAFIIVALIILFAFGTTGILQCERVEPTLVSCVKQVKWLSIVPRAEERIPGLQGAWVDESCDDSCTYRVVLITERGNVPLTDYYSSGRQSKEEKAARINRFVQGWEKTLEMEDGGGLWVVLVSAVFMIAGMATVFVQLCHSWW